MILHRQGWHYQKQYHCLIDVALMLLTVVGIVLLLVLTTDAQTLQRMEYYIDTDPGYGLATAVPMQSGAIVDTAFTANLSGLSLGFHLLVIRTGDNQGRWSLPLLKPFLVETISATIPDVSAAEYFLDSDPGYGSGTAIPVTTGQSVPIDFTVNLTSVTPGFHALYTRIRDANGNWSLPLVKPILVESIATTPSDIAGAEYFLDTDPGYGNGTAIPVVPGQSVTLTYTTNLSGLSNGFHAMFTRTRDTNGKWSLPMVKSFLVETISATLPNVTGGEYYIDTDPGFGGGTPITVAAAQNIDVTFLANLTNLPVGYHNLVVRMRDASGKWSLPFLYQVNVLEPPGEPQFLLITYDRSLNRAILQWSAATPSTGPIRFYRIYRSTEPYFTPPSSGGWIGTTDGTTTVYYDENVTQNQYYYRVTAIDDQAR